MSKEIITALIAAGAGSLVPFLGYSFYRFIIKPSKNLKEKSNIMKYSVLKDLESKGITQAIRKEDLKHAKKQWKKIHRDNRLTKASDKLSKKFN